MSFGRNARRAASRVAGAVKGIGDVGPAVTRQRLSVCQRCPVFDGEFCAKERGGCGCFMPVKARYEFVREAHGVVPNTCIHGHW